MMTTRTTSPDVYLMAHGRALHEPSGLWHYVRAYGHNHTEAELALATEALRRNWVLDSSSVRTVETRKGAF